MTFRVTSGSLPRRSRTCPNPPRREEEDKGGGYGKRTNDDPILKEKEELIRTESNDYEIDNETKPREEST